MKLQRILIMGASSSIASALTHLLTTLKPEPLTIYLCSQKKLTDSHPSIHHCTVNYHDEQSLVSTAQYVEKSGPLDLIFVANGKLHDQVYFPEKSFLDLDATQLHDFFHSNTVVPALTAKHFIPILNKKRKSCFVALSARIGSISDNRLGGWHAYRASKSALNMIIKNIAIELKYKQPEIVVLGIHPGTVDTPLSLPFQKNIKKNSLKTPIQAAKNIMNIIEFSGPKESGSCIAWDGKKILP